ncbi:MAG TPA: NUDIX hydrolase [Friedmanniella sp.]
MLHDGNGWVVDGAGQRHWGRFGAAGLLVVDRRGPGGPVVLLQHRAAWTADGGTWGIPGGARDSHEDAVAGALREAFEETGLPPEAVRIGGEPLVDDRGGWSYTTVLAELVADVTLVVESESEALGWVDVDDVDQRLLHPGFARAWPTLRARLETPTG